MLRSTQPSTPARQSAHHLSHPSFPHTRHNHPLPLHRPRYGEKVQKRDPNPRSYYRCTEPSCPARKVVARQGANYAVIAVRYKDEHNHALQ